MTFWNCLRSETLRRAQALLRMFRRQTVPVRPLTVLPPQHFVPRVLPQGRTVLQDGREISIYPGEADIRFPVELYAQAINRGAARDAEWAHVIMADRQITEQVFQDLFPSSPAQSPQEPDAPLPEFLVHTMKDRRAWR
jgi:hypothetical protein